jgi:hypothetical protein
MATKTMTDEEKLALRKARITRMKALSRAVPGTIVVATACPNGHNYGCGYPILYAPNEERSSGFLLDGTRGNHLDPYYPGHPYLRPAREDEVEAYWGAIDRNAKAESVEKMAKAIGLE